MGRSVSYDVPTDSCHFGPYQLHPRTVLVLGFTGFSQWIREYVIDYPTMVKQHKVNVPIVGVRVEYPQRFDFFDAPIVQVRSSVRVRKDGGLVMLDVELWGGPKNLAKLGILMRPVHVKEEASFSAAPGPLPEPLLSRFQDNELVESSPGRAVPELLKSLDGKPVVGEAVRPFVVSRQMCDLVDQWCFMEVPGLVAPNREQISVSQSDRVPELGLGMSNPLRVVEFELRRPFYLLDEGTVATKAYVVDGKPVYVHQLFSASRKAEPHGTIIEQVATDR